MILAGLYSGAFALQAPVPGQRAPVDPRVLAQPPTPLVARQQALNVFDRRALLQTAGVAATGAAMLGAEPAFAAPKTWDVVNLPIISETAPILFDIEFDTKDPNRGWIVGNRGTFLETSDGGKSWSAKSFANLDPDEEINYRFTKISFKDGEGWIIGKPAILLHTRDSGASWERVPLSPKLPGDPYSIVALGPGKAEMSTSAGAIYTTENAGRNWKAEVRDARGKCLDDAR